MPAGATTQTLDAFFGELADGDDAKRFAKLRAAIDATLTDAKVYRAGGPEVSVSILGTTKSGTIAGLHTTSVET